MKANKHKVIMPSSSWGQVSTSPNHCYVLSLRSKPENFSYGIPLSGKLTLVELKTHYFTFLPIHGNCKNAAIYLFPIHMNINSLNKFYIIK